MTRLTRPPSPGRATRASWHVRANALVVAWLAAALVATLAHRSIASAEWVLVHLLLLGAVSTAILVWSQHFADTLLRRPARGGRAAHGLRLGLHSAGALVVVVAVPAGRWPAAVAGGALVAGVAAWHAVVIGAQLRAAFATRFGHAVRYYVAASAALVVGVGLGVTMAHGHVSDELHARLYVAHVVLTLPGWVGLSVLGTLLVLWPTVLHARIEPRDEALGRRALPVTVAGLAIAGAGAATGWRGLVALGSVVLVGGTACVARAMVGQARASRPSTYAAWSIAAALAWSAGATLALGVAALVGPTWPALAAGARGVVAPFAVGFAAQVLVGSLSHLLPVVLGGGPSTVRRTAAELDRGGACRVVLVNGGLALFVASVPSAVRVVVSFVVLGALGAFLVLAVRAWRLTRRPAVPVEAMNASAVEASGAAAVPPVAPAVARPPVPRAGGVVVAVSVLAVAVVAGVAADPPAAGLGVVSAAGAGVVATGRTTTVDVRAEHLRFSPARIEVPAGDRLVVRVTNADSDVHDLTIATGVSTGRIAPGQTAQVDVGVVGSDLDAWCSVAGHRAMGMTLAIVATGRSVVAAATPSPSADPLDADDTGDGTGMTGMAGMDGMAGMTSTAGGTPQADATPTPGATAPAGLVARDATAPAREDPAAGAVTHRVTLTVRDVLTEVAPGVTQTLWTYDGTAPGPVLRGKVGDTFVVTLVNRGDQGHSVDFHAGALAPDGPMRTIAPGQRLTYTFTATRSGIWLYHCSTMPMSEHLANGMVGAVVVDPPGLPDVDREYVLVQSELYLGPQGGVADAAKIAAKEPDLVVFNGYANQYRDRPLTARVGERVRFWVLDAGPNEPSAFHVVGGQFDTVYKEGDWLLRDGGSTGTGGSQALDLAPAQGGFVELTFPEAGTYSFVTHAMSDAEHGAAGRIVVSR